MKIYILLSLLVTLTVIYKLWLEDTEAAAKGETDKWGYYFRKHGRKEGKFWITETALVFIIPTLPFVNIIAAIFLAYVWFANRYKRK